MPGEVRGFEVGVKREAGTPKRPKPRSQDQIAKTLTVKEAFAGVP